MKQQATIHSILQTQVDDLSMVDDGSVVSFGSSANCTKKKSPLKKAKVADVGTAITAAAKSYEKIAASFSQRQNSQVPSGQDDNDDWLFAKRVFNKLKAIPEGRENELLKNRIDAELVWMAYGSSEINATWQQNVMYPPPPPPPQAHTSQYHAAQNTQASYMCFK